MNTSSCEWFAVRFDGEASTEHVTCVSAPKGDSRAAICAAFDDMRMIGYDLSNEELEQHFAVSVERLVDIWGSPGPTRGSKMFDRVLASWGVCSMCSGVGFVRTELLVRSKSDPCSHCGGPFFECHEHGSPFEVWDECELSDIDLENPEQKVCASSPAEAAECAAASRRNDEPVYDGEEWRCWVRKAGSTGRPVFFEVEVSVDIAWRAMDEGEGDG